MCETLVIYTVAMGDEYPLPDIVPCPDVTYLCFTDSPALEPNGWTLKHITPFFPLDLVRSSREQKIRPHRWLKDYDRSIYIDTSVQLTGSPTDLWDHLMPRPEVVFGGMYHSFRETVEDEFGLVKGKGFEDSGILARQYETYRTTNPDILQRHPVWGGLLARRHNDPDLIEAMELWFAHVLRYARRDQLSLVLALSGLADAQVSLRTGNNHQSDFHIWPVGRQDKPKRFFQELNRPDHGLAGGISRNWRRVMRRLKRMRR